MDTILENTDKWPPEGPGLFFGHPATESVKAKLPWSDHLGEPPQIRAPNLDSMFGSHCGPHVGPHVWTPLLDPTLDPIFGPHFEPHFWAETLGMYEHVQKREDNLKVWVSWGGPGGVPEASWGVLEASWGLLTAQRRPKRLQDSPRGAQDSPGGAQDSPRGAQDGPKGAQVSPRGAQEAPQRFPRRPRDPRIKTLVPPSPTFEITL